LIFTGAQMRPIRSRVVGATKRGSGASIFTSGSGGVSPEAADGDAPEDDAADDDDAPEDDAADDAAEDDVGGEDLAGASRVAGEAAVPGGGNGGPPPAAAAARIPSMPAMQAGMVRTEDS
jgi:hypothetical protein